MGHGYDGAASDPAHTTFVRLRRTTTDAAAEELVLSRAAMHLHTFGMLSSIEAGDPGFVSDRYLDAITAETSITALELWLAGLWERTSCGYRVSDADTLSVAEQIHGHLHDLATRCLSDGGHIIDPHHPGSCAKCGASQSDGEYRPRHRAAGTDGDRADAA